MSKIKDAMRNARLEAGFAYQKAKRSLGIIALGAACVYATLHIPYGISSIKNDIVPSKERQHIERTYDIEIEGWNSELEDKKFTMELLEKTIEKEMKEKKFDINSIRIRSKNQLLNNIADHFNFAIMPDGGYFNPATDNIVVESMYVPTLVHEIKHAKTSEILKEHPEFKTEWESLAKNEWGKSLYKSSKNVVFSRIRGLRGLVDKKTDDECKSLGFISDYARTNFYEDVAELGEEIETNPRTLQLRGLSPNDRLAGKIKLLEKYDLIPKGFFNYIQLNDLHTAAVSDWSHYGGSLSYTPAKAYDFLQKSEEYVSSDAELDFRMEILMHRASIVKSFGHPWKGEAQLPKGDLQTNPDFWQYAVGLEEAQEELYRLLESPGNASYYDYALRNLGSLNSWNGKHEDAMHFYQALALHERRWMENGSAKELEVKEFLKEKGLLK